MRLALLSLLLLPVAALAAEPPPVFKEPPHPFSARDLVEMQRISEPAPSPDGKQVAFVLRTTDLEANKGRTDLWMINVDGTGLRQLTFTPESESSPLFSPDGKSLYFLSTRGGASAVWRLPLDGGEAQKISNVALDVNGFALSPDGARLALAVDVFVDCPDLECTKKRLDEREKRKATGQIFTRLLFRHWDSLSDGRRSHLFVVPVAGGTPVDVTRGLDADVPSKPFGGTEELTFTPDGKALVFSAKDEGSQEAWTTNFDLFLSPADGSAPPQRLTAANKAWDTGPVFSPDGATLAWRAMSKPGYEADRFRIMVKKWPDGAERELAPKWDRSPGSLAFSHDGKTLFATADHFGHVALFAIDVASGQVREVFKDGTIYSASPLPDGRLLIARDHLRSPVELYTLQPDGSGLRAVTEVNAERLRLIAMGEPEQFSFIGAGGDTVYAWLVKPAFFDPAKKYPLAVLVHGGPQGSFPNEFHYRWNPQVYAGAGYAALMIDFHGSTGYGQKFTDAIQGDWGGKPLEDTQKGLAAALARYRFLDGNRVAALGASYGAYLINWMAGMWPDRFRCLVTHDGNLDEQFAYFDTEELWFPEHDHEGTPWDNPAGYQKHNPVNLVKKWKAPMLVVHGGKDFRVVETQGFATFTAAQRRGIPSELLYFPDENHWVLKPANSLLWHEAVLGWLDRWMK